MKYQKRLLLSSLIAVCLIGFGVMSNWYLVQVQPLEAPNPYQELYDELLRPSVQVSTPSGTGSGVVISHRGDAENIYILSAAHVVDDESSVKVTFFYPNNNSTTITGSVVATNTIKDLALIKAYSSAVRAKRVTADYSWQYSAKAELPDYTYKPYPYVAKLAPRTYQPYIFTPVWVVGCSLGLPPRPTAGQITAVSSPSPFSSPSRGEDRERVNHWQINAPIWPGNSGGGVFLKETNELIGIAVRVKVYGGQLVSTMGSIVPLQDIYEFIDSQAHRFTGPAVTHELVNSYRELKDSKRGGD